MIPLKPQEDDMEELTNPARKGMRLGRSLEDFFSKERWGKSFLYYCQLFSLAIPFPVF